MCTPRHVPLRLPPLDLFVLPGQGALSDPDGRPHVAGGGRAAEQY